MKASTTAINISLQIIEYTHDMMSAHVTQLLNQYILEHRNEETNNLHSNLQGSSAWPKEALHLEMIKNLITHHFYLFLHCKH